MKTIEVLVGLIAVRELEIKTLQERISWLENYNYGLQDSLNQMNLQLDALLKNNATLKQELNKLNTLKSTKQDHEIGFNHESKT